MAALIELVTAQGHKFFSAAFVHVGGRDYDMDELTDAQRLFVSGKLHEQALNAAFAGEGTFSAQGLPDIEDVFL